MISDILSRKRIYADVDDIVFSYRGETRIGREFAYRGSLSDIDLLLGIQNRLSTDLVLFPDEKHMIDENRICLSISADGLSPFSGKPRNFNELFEPVDELHSCGFLHLGISCDSFMIRGDQCVLMAWGDPLLTSGGKTPPEISCGGFSCKGSDYYLLGSMLSSSTCRIWNGNDAPNLKQLKHWNPSRRLRIMDKLSCKIPSFTLPPSRSCSLLRGGSWRERDIILNEFLCTAWKRGWQTAVIKCRFQESHRPLPGAVRPGNCIDSPRALIENTFPRIEGVSKLLVVDQIDYASEDLKAVLKLLSDTMTSDLAVIVSSSSDEWSIQGDNINIIQLDDPPSAASILDPAELLEAGSIKVYPFRSGSSFQFRTDIISDLELQALSTEQLHKEGSYRFLISEAEHNSIKPGDHQILIDSFLKLGMFDEALNIIPDNDHSTRGRVYQKKADFQLSLLSFHTAINAGADPVKLGLPYVISLVETGDRDKAKALIQDSDDVESIVYLSWILDCEGKIQDALRILDEALSRTVSEKRIPLLTSKTIHCMRIGMYDKALVTITEAKILADNSVDPDQRQICHITLGRVLEAMGLWQDALDNYRIATSLGQESYNLNYVSRLVHKYVLEFRMGNIRLAENTLREIKSVKIARESRIYQQRISMIEAYSSVMLCKGEAAMETVNKTVAMSSELQLTLMTGICMLYKGKLLVQSGREQEGQKFLEQSKATGISLNDKHLILLADLALCYIQKPSNSESILNRARDLKLKFEELEARVILENDTFRDKAFEELLDLPAPLKACELATRFGAPDDIRLRNRLLSAFRNICEMLNEKDRSVFEIAHPALQNMVQVSKENCRLPENATLRNQLKCLSEWIPVYTSGQVDISDLCDRFGLSCSEEPPAGKPRNTIKISLPEGRMLFVSGEDTSGLSLLEPVIASIMAICHSHSPLKKSKEVDFPEIIARSEVMLEVKHRIRKIAGTKVPVLITGETGTGKDLVARAIYRVSGRGEPFVTVDCGTIPENLIEAELFGSAKGSYTDSKSDRIGLIESANGGTLFLDEIGNMPLQLQTRLLRVIESGYLRRIGETVERKLDFRLITATNSDLCDRVSRGKFRSDLYYRIAVMVINIPPLRERTEDIPLLVRYFINQLAEPNTKPPTFLKASLNSLYSYKWPGNIRELRNVVHRSMLLSSGKIIRESDISFESTIPDNGQGISNTSMQKLEDVITHHIYRTYSLLKNKTRTAEALQCDPKTVAKYIRKYESEFK